MYCRHDVLCSFSAYLGTLLNSQQQNSAVGSLFMFYKYLRPRQKVRPLPEAQLAAHQKGREVSPLLGKVNKAPIQSSYCKGQQTDSPCSSWDMKTYLGILANAELL